MAENRVGNAASADGKNMIKDALILFAITLISGLLLGLVYQVTAEPRREQQERKIREACQAVFAQADKFETIDYTVNEALAEQLAGDGVKIGTVYQAVAGAGLLNGFKQRLLGSVQQRLRFPAYFSAGEGPGVVAVKPLIAGPHVYADDVAPL